MHLSAHQSEPQPLWVRQIGDGLEAILDAYVFEKKRGILHESWLDYCTRTADWLAGVQNEDGSCGYRYAGLVNEGAHFSEQEYRSRYHWLPWCTYVEVDPASRFEDTFGYHEIGDIEKLPREERMRRNRIYDNYAG